MALRKGRSQNRTKKRRVWSLSTPRVQACRARKKATFDRRKLQKDEYRARTRGTAAPPTPVALLPQTPVAEAPQTVVDALLTLARLPGPTHAFNLRPLWCYCILVLTKNLENCKTEKKARDRANGWRAVYCTGNPRNPKEREQYKKDFAFVAAATTKESPEALEAKVDNWASTRMGHICGAVCFGDMRERDDDDKWGVPAYGDYVVEATATKLFAQPVKVDNSNDRASSSRQGFWKLAHTVPYNKKKNLPACQWDHVAQVNEQFAATAPRALPPT